MTRLIKSRSQLPDDTIEVSDLGSPRWALRIQDRSSKRPTLLSSPFGLVTRATRDELVAARPNSEGEPVLVQCLRVRRPDQKHGGTYELEVQP